MKFITPTLQPLTLISYSIIKSPSHAADCLRSIEDHRLSSDFFHRQLEDSWKEQSDLADQIASLALDGFSASETSKA